MVSFRKETGEYLVDYSKFNATNEVQTPLCSARDFEEYQRLLSEKQSTPPIATPNDHNSTSTNEDGRDSFKRSLSSPNGVPVEQSLSLAQNTTDTPVNLGPMNTAVNLGLNSVDTPINLGPMNTAVTLGQNSVNTPNNSKQNTVNTPVNLGQPTVDTPTNIGQPTIAMSMSSRHPIADTPLHLEQPTVDTPLLRDMSNTSDC